MPVWLCLLFCLLFTGCGSSQEPFVWQGRTLAANLDPQVTSQEGDLLALRHLYRGLFRTDAQGQPQPDGCQTWQVSRDGLVWTFILAEDLVWWDGQPVTSRDYAYGISRALDPDTGSPWQEKLEGIAGVDCPAPETLVVTLDRPLDLRELLALAGSYPCREDFFQAAQGQYGLTVETTLGCGVYRLKSWGKTSLTLARCQGEGIPTLRLAGPGWTGTPTGRLVVQEEGEGLPLVTWALCLNPEREVLGNLSVRQAIGAALWSGELTFGPGLREACQLYPPALGLEEGVLPQLGDPAPLLWAGLEELGLDSVKGLVLLAPEDPLFQDLVNSLNRELQQRLGIFCRVELVSLEVLEERKAAEDYDLALFPFQAADGSPETFLEDCRALTGSLAGNQEELLAECFLLPLCWEEFRLETQVPVEGLWVNPYTGSPDFTQAQYP